MEQTSPLPNPTTPPQMLTTPPVNPPSSNRSVLIIFLIVFVIILVSLNAYLFLKLQKQSQVPVASPAPIVQASPTPTPDPTANWKTFSGQKITFKYPNDWTATEEFQEYYKDLVVTISNPSKKVAIEIYPKQPPYGFGEEEKVVTNNILVVMERKEYSAKENIIADKTAFVDLKYPFNQKEYHILFGTGHPLNSDLTASLTEYLSDKTIILQILSTFKFLQ